MISVFDKARAVDILQVARAAGLRLNKSGRRYFVNCPVHKEQTPSCVINTEGKHANTFHCFGCGVGGSVIDLYSILHNIEIKEAANILSGGTVAASLPVVQVAEYKPEPIDTHSEIFTKFIAWCKSHETTSQKRKVLEYLQRRGLTYAMIKRAGLAAIPSADVARRFLLSPDNELKARAAGLIIDYDNQQNVFALTNHPLLIPSVDINRKIISIQGRAIDDSIKPKYRYLRGVQKYPFGIHSLDNTKRVVLCEGVFDAIAFHGIEGSAAIALGGLSIPSLLPPLIRGRYVIICLDNDKQPDKAAQREKDFVRIKEKLHGAGIKHVFKGNLINQAANDAGELLAATDEAKLELMMKKNKSLKKFVDLFKLKIEK